SVASVKESPKESKLSPELEKIVTEKTEIVKQVEIVEQKIQEVAKDEILKVEPTSKEPSRPQQSAELKEEVKEVGKESPKEISRPESSLSPFRNRQEISRPESVASVKESPKESNCRANFQGALSATIIRRAERRGQGSWQGVSEGNLQARVRSQTASSKDEAPKEPEPISEPTKEISRPESVASSKDEAPKEPEPISEPTKEISRPESVASVKESPKETKLSPELEKIVTEKTEIVKQVEIVEQKIQEVAKDEILKVEPTSKEPSRPQSSAELKEEVKKPESVASSKDEAPKEPEPISEPTKEISRPESVASVKESPKESKLSPEAEKIITEKTEIVKQVEIVAQKIQEVAKDEILKVEPTSKEPSRPQSSAELKEEVKKLARSLRRKSPGQKSVASVKETPKETKLSPEPEKIVTEKTEIVKQVEIVEQRSKKSPRMRFLRSSQLPRSLSATIIRRAERREISRPESVASVKESPKESKLSPELEKIVTEKTEIVKQVEIVEQKIQEVAKDEILKVEPTSKEPSRPQSSAELKEEVKEVGKESPKEISRPESVASSKDEAPKEPEPISEPTKEISRPESVASVKESPKETKLSPELEKIVTEKTEIVKQVEIVEQKIQEVAKDEILKVEPTSKEPSRPQSSAELKEEVKEVGKESPKEISRPESVASSKDEAPKEPEPISEPTKEISRPESVASVKESPKESKLSPELEKIVTEDEILKVEPTSKEPSRPQSSAELKEEVKEVGKESPKEISRPESVASSKDEAPKEPEPISEPTKEISRPESVASVKETPKESKLSPELEKIVTEKTEIVKQVEIVEQKIQEVAKDEILKVEPTSKEPSRPQSSAELKEEVKEVGKESPKEISRPESVASSKDEAPKEPEPISEPTKEISRPESVASVKESPKETKLSPELEKIVTEKTEIPTSKEPSRPQSSAELKEEVKEVGKESPKEISRPESVASSKDEAPKEPEPISEPTKEISRPESVASSKDEAPKEPEPISEPTKEISRPESVASVKETPKESKLSPELEKIVTEKTEIVKQVEIVAQKIQEVAKDEILKVEPTSKEPSRPQSSAELKEEVKEVGKESPKEISRPESVASSKDEAPKEPEPISEPTKEISRPESVASVKESPKETKLSPELEKIVTEKTEIVKQVEIVAQKIQEVAKDEILKVEPTSKEPSRPQSSAELKEEVKEVGKESPKEISRPESVASSKDEAPKEPEPISEPTKEISRPESVASSKDEAPKEPEPISEPTKEISRPESVASVKESPKESKLSPELEKIVTEKTEIVKQSCEVKKVDEILKSPDVVEQFPGPDSVPSARDVSPDLEGSLQFATIHSATEVASSEYKEESLSLHLEIVKKTVDITEYKEAKTPSPSKSPLKDPVEFHEVIQIPLESTFVKPLSSLQSSTECSKTIDILELPDVYSSESVTEVIEQSSYLPQDDLIAQEKQDVESIGGETRTGHSEEPDSLVPRPEIDFIPLDKIHLSAVDVSSLASSVLPSSASSDAAEGSDVVLERSPERKSRRSRTEDTLLGEEFLRAGRDLLEDDSPQLTDVTSSSMTNVTDRIESSLETDWTADDDSAGQTPAKSLGQSFELERTLQVTTRYESERSISASDNAASDISNDSMRKFVSNLPHDSDSSCDVPKIRTSSSEEKMSSSGHEEIHHHIIEKTQKVDSSSPLSDLTECTESVSAVESIIEGTGVEKKELLKKIKSVDKIEKSELPEKIAAKQERFEKKLEERETIIEKSMKPAMKKKDIKVQLVTKPLMDSNKIKEKTSKVQKIDIGKSSTKKIHVSRKTEDVSVTSSSTRTTTVTSSRVYGYMQSTLSRDQKIGKGIAIPEKRVSTPTRSVSRSETPRTPVKKAEAKSRVDTFRAKTPDVKVEKKTFEKTTSQVERKKKKVDEPEKKTTSKVGKSSPPASFKDDKKKIQTKSVAVSKVATIKSNKDTKNLSLIPVRKTKTEVRKEGAGDVSHVKVKKSTMTTTKITLHSSSDEEKMKKGEKVKRSSPQEPKRTLKRAELKEKLLSQEARREARKIGQEIDSYRSQSALPFTHREYVSRDKSPASLPSSPNHLRRSIQNGSQVITSEVFTRTVDSSRSIEVIYRQPSTSNVDLVRRLNDYKCNDVDVSFIETTDSSLSDSIALPSSSSDHENDGFGKWKRSCSPASPKPTKRALQMLEHKIGRKSETLITSTIEDEEESAVATEGGHAETEKGAESVVAVAHVAGVTQESRLSPILAFKAVSPPRMKHKFDYESLSTQDKKGDSKEHRDSELSDSDSLKGDDFDKLVRCEAIHLVDSVLEQSLSIVHSQQQPQCLTDGGQSESEHFAITSDISNGVDFVKSPTIESISGKSFDDDNEGIDQVVVDAKAARIDRRFERLSSQLDDQELNDDAEFERAMAAIDRDEVSQLQSDFSKMSWDESVSATTAEHALSTPDTDLQDLNQEPRRDPDTLPKPTPRLSKSITDESGEVSSSVATEDKEKTFSEKKIFWESLESPKDGEKLLEEVAKGARAAPIPKPRVQLSTSLSKGEESSEAPSLREDTKSERSEISSERHVEYGESDSARSITESRSAGKEEDSITMEERLDDESFPLSDRLDSSEKRDEAEDKTEYVEDDHNLMKTDDESETGEAKQAKFYIGESSKNIITKTQTEKRSEFAYDNDGYRTTQESVTLEEEMSLPSSSAELEKHQRMTVEKSETEISEKIRYASVKVSQMDQDEEEAKLHKAPEMEKVPVIHSPIKPYQSVVDFETPVPVQEDVVTTAKATAIDVLGDEAKKQASIESVSESQSLKESSRIVEAQTKSTDEIAMERTLAEVSESLDAVQEELIETVKDGKLIKQSPSEFEFKVLPHIKYTEETIHESYQEDSSHGDVSLGERIVEKAVSQKPDAQDASSSQQSSAEDSSQKLDVVQRKQKGSSVPGSNRWSVTDQDNYSSSDSHYQSFEKTESRPASSDVENLLTSEYQTAMDNSFRPGSTEYHSAVSTLEYSAGATISSRESMKSFDSESSGHLASVEVSEASETLIPSTMDLEMETSEAETEEGEMKYGSLEEKGGTILLEFDDSAEPVASGSMKRSQEMTFQPELKPIYPLESPEITEKDDLRTAVTESSRIMTSSEEIKISGSGSYDETRFASSLEDGSILSVSLSSASCIETVMENAPEGFDIPSLSGSLTGSYELHHKLTDDIIATSFEESDLTFKPDDVVLTSSAVMDDARSTTTESQDSPDSGRKPGKGHKRNDSTSFASFKGFDSGSKPPSDELDDLDEEMIIHEQEPHVTLLRETFISEDQRGSGSDSDYDRYETEYSRAYKTPADLQSKKGKRAAEMRTETFEKDMDIKRSRSPSQSIIETIEEDVNAEAECQQETQQTLKQVSQNLQDYSNVPNITITDDPNKYVSDDEDIQVPSAPPASLKEEPPKPQVKSPTEEQKIQYAQQREYKMTEDQYEELLERQSKSKITDPVPTYSFEEAQKDEARGDSPGSDSFEMLEQPDISDEFVIIEEVAKEANEMDVEGKSVKIKPTKYVKKHDEDLEKYIVHSAPADPNAGSIIYSDVHNREQIGFDFEESPPQEGGKAEKDPNIEASKKWVEMQLADNAQNLRYPYELERGVLEDIKEEDNEMEVGSSRISSFKDSFSSTPEYDVLAGRKCFNKENDDISMSSLQEFENLEQAISLENRRQHQGSQDSLSNGSFPKRYLARSAEGDGISLSSLKEFEGLENACLEAHLLEIKAKEEAALLLSRSDESNKSDSSGKGGKTEGTEITSTVTTVTTVTKTSNGATKVMTSSGFQVLKHKLDEIEDESLPSNIMETSTDSLEASKPKAGASGSRRESVDSLEINKSGMDAMTSSMDSIELMREGVTAKSSKSEADSIEQVVPSAVKSDSTDSIEQQQAGSNRFSQQYDEDSIEEETNVTQTTVMSSSGQHQVITTTTTVTRTGGPQSFGAIPKDISSDSLNPLEGDLLLTSSESLDQYTSSTATNATYQTDRDSQMSGSMTSCDSNTMIDTLDSNVAEYYSSQGPSPLFFEDRTILSGASRREATQKGDSLLFDPFDPFESQSDKE
ncbi:microtubule-associated protein futsch-like, partial [Phlebotomus argentipes]|uniref:microtubule-associated protein futsch-like n=1 Tax=Phlebotomus argentipes TaxID=94469 RepID=UPI0028938050